MDKSEEEPLATDDKNKTANRPDAFSLDDIFKSNDQTFSQTAQNLSNSELAKSFSKATVDLKSGVIDFFSIGGKDDAKAKDGSKNEKESPKDGEKSKFLEIKDAEEFGKKLSAGKEADNERVSRKALEELASNTIKDDGKRSSFLTNVESFESRASKDKLEPEQKERFYAQIRDVLEASKTGNKHFDSAYLQTMANDMIKQGAKPGSVNQGGYGTCTAAALQSALFKAEPATIGGLVRDLALSGEYKTVDGSSIKPSEKNLKVDKYHTETSPYSRNSVDQLAQIGLLNVFWQRQAGLEGNHKALVGKIKYEEGHPRDNISDNRTRLMDYSKGAPRPITSPVAVDDPGSKEDLSQYGGIAEDRPVSGPRILDMANINDMYDQLKGNKGNLKVISGDGSDPVFKPKSEAELKEFIEKARKENNGVLPAMVLGVFTNVEPFKTDLKDAFYSKENKIEPGKDPTAIHSHHAVAIFDFDAANNKTIIENQWGDNVDHTGAKGSKPPVDLKDVFKAIKGEAEPQEDKGPGAKEDKPEKPETEKDKEAARVKNARIYIDEYKKLVNELENDSDANPRNVFQHQQKFHEYLKSWDRKDEDKEQLTKLGTQLGKVLPGMSQTELESVFSSLAKDLKANGLEDKANEIGSMLDQRLQSKIKDLGDKEKTFSDQRDMIDAVESAFKAFKEGGDLKAIERISQKLVSTADARRTEYGVNDKSSVQTTSAILGALNTVGSQKELSKLVDSTLTAIREADKSANGDKTATLKSTISLAELSGELGNSELSKKLFSELEDTYKKRREQNAPKDSKSDQSDLLFSLMNHHRKLHNGDKLEPLMTDWVKNIKSEIEKDKGTEERKNNWRVNMLEHAAEMLNEVKKTEPALKYYKEALESARKLDKSGKAENIAMKTIRCCESLGKKEEAAALAREFKLERWLRK